MSFFKDEFREYVDTLVVALRQIEKAESPMRHVHPIVLRETPLPQAGTETGDSHP